MPIKHDKTRLSTSEVVKAAGLPNLKTLQELTGTHRNVLDGWNKGKPDLFDMVLLGAATAQAAPIVRAALGILQASLAQQHNDDARRALEQARSLNDLLAQYSVNKE